jgi:hypothetical protein
LNHAGLQYVSKGRRKLEVSNAHFYFQTDKWNIVAFIGKEAGIKVKKNSI